MPARHLSALSMWDEGECTEEDRECTEMTASPLGCTNTFQYTRNCTGTLESALAIIPLPVRDRVH